MPIAELSRIDRTIEIEAPPQRVWRALTSRDELSAWFQVRIEGEITAGSEVWMTSVHPQHAGQRWWVRILELAPPRTVVWQWQATDHSEDQTTVTFTLEPSERGTRLSVAETGFDEIALARRAKAYADNSQGWADVMAWLQTYAETNR